MTEDLTHTLNGTGRLETPDAEWRAYCHALDTGDMRTVEYYEERWIVMTKQRRPEEDLTYFGKRNRIHERIFHAASKIRIDWTDPAHRELAEALIEMRQLRDICNMGEQYFDRPKEAVRIAEREGASNAR